MISSETEQKADPTGLPWDISDLAPRKEILAWIDQQLETIDWANPNLVTFEQKHPDYRPRMFLRLLAYAYAVGMFASEDIVEACYHDDLLRFVSEGDPPPARSIIAFRRENRGMLQWLLVEIFKNALKRHFKEDFLISPGLRKFLADAASSRIDASRHMDRGAREE